MWLAAAALLQASLGGGGWEPTASLQQQRRPLGPHTEGWLPCTWGPGPGSGGCDRGGALQSSPGLGGGSPIGPSPQPRWVPETPLRVEIKAMATLPRRFQKSETVSEGAKGWQGGGQTDGGCRRVPPEVNGPRAGEVGRLIVQTYCPWDWLGVRATQQPHVPVSRTPHFPLRHSLSLGPGALCWLAQGLPSLSHDTASKVLWAVWTQERPPPQPLAPVRPS